MKKKALYFCISLFSLSLFIFLWWLVTDGLGIFPAKALPSPAKVVTTFIAKWTKRAPDGGTMPEHIWASLKLALYGFFLGAVIGIPVGIMMAWNHKADLLILSLIHI